MNGSLRQLIQRAEKEQYHEGNRRAKWMKYRLDVLRTCRDMQERDEAMRQIDRIFDTDLRLQEVEWMTN